MATARKFSAEEQRKLLAELEVPFDPAMVKWKVVRRAHSGRRGAILPFAGPRLHRSTQPSPDSGWLGPNLHPINPVEPDPSPLGRKVDLYRQAAGERSWSKEVPTF